MQILTKTLLRFVSNSNYTSIMSGNSKLPGVFLITTILTGTLLMNSCVKDPTLPILTTDEAIEVTTNSATVGGDVTEDGGAEVTARGICWGTGTMPTLNDNFKASGTGPGEFSCTLDKLVPNTKYYSRAYAENSVGIAFGNEVVFTTGIGTPSVTTGQVTGITDKSAVCSGTVTDNGGASNTEKGICWSLLPDPDLGDDSHHVSVNTGPDIYNCTLTELSSGTLYYVRAYVRNGGGTTYGDQIEFRTKVADAEGNLYGTVLIGDQVWMTENLRVLKYNDNSDIPNITENSEWIGQTEGAYCWYENDISYKTTIGALYNWYAVGTGKLCPVGWHVPTNEEFNTLELFLGMDPESIDVWDWRGTDQGSQLKSTTGWKAGENGTNSSGFSAIPGGYRYGADGGFNALDKLTYYWCSERNTELAWYRRLDGPETGIFKGSTYKRGGKYIRCIKN